MMTEKKQNRKESLELLRQGQEQGCSIMLMKQYEKVTGKTLSKRDTVIVNIWMGKYNDILLL